MEPKEGTPRSVAGQSEAGVKSWAGWWVEPFPCRVWCYLQVDSIRTELRGRTSTWCRELFGVGEDPHSRTGVSSTIILRCKGLLTSPGRSEDRNMGSREHGSHVHIMRYDVTCLCLKHTVILLKLWSYTMIYLNTRPFCIPSFLLRIHPSQILTFTCVISNHTSSFSLKFLLQGCLSRALGLALLLSLFYTFIVCCNFTLQYIS